MQLSFHSSKQEMAECAAARAAERIRHAIDSHGSANIILGTGASQLEVLQYLVAADTVDWGRVTAFHLDEYIGMPESHPASFRRYLRERFVARLPEPLGEFHFIDGEVDAESECQRVGELISRHRIDLAMVGIGENGHLAFNDPPADFQTERPFIIVALDEACRKQQFGEGWFPTLADVPTRAISMSVRQILKSAYIVCTVPDARKAKAAQAALEGPVTPDVPASILQQHPSTTVFLDPDAASLLKK